MNGGPRSGDRRKEREGARSRLIRLIVDVEARRSPTLGAVWRASI